MASNIGRMTNLAASPTTGMVDGIDSLHTGIIKALEIMAKGRMIIKCGTFGLSASGGYTRYSLADPQYIYDGKVYSHSGTLTVDQTSSHASNGTYSRYVWVLLDINSGGTPHIELSIESNIYSSPRIKDIADGYIPIALVNIEAGSAADATNRSFQMFTQTVTDNSVSIGYNNSGYTQKGELSAAAGGLTIAGTTSTIVTTPFMSIGNGTTNEGELRLLEDVTNGVLYTGFKAPAQVTGNSVYTLPAAFPGSSLVLQSTSGGVLSWVAQTGGSVSGVANGADNRLATFSSADALNGEANLTFDGSALALTGTQTVTGSITVDKNFTGTTTATTKGAFIDFDATGITASGQTATNVGLDLDMNSNSPTMVGTVNNTGIDVALTGGTSGVQKNIGISATVTGADTNYPLIAYGGNSGFGTATPTRLLSLTDMDGGTNSVQPVLRLTELSAGVTPAVGLGVGMEFEISTSVGNEEIGATIDAVISDATGGGEDFNLVFNTMLAGATANERLRLGRDVAGTPSCVFNEAGDDVDFRVEGDTNTNMITVDAGNDTIGLGMAPLNTIDFAGNQGNSLVVLTAASNAVATIEDARYVVFLRGSAIGVTMPAGPEGRTYNFKNSMAGQATLTCAGSDNFRKLDASMGGTATTLVLDVGQYAEVVYNAASAFWEVMVIGNSI